MALCSIGIAAGIVGVVALVRGLVWRRRLGCRSSFGHLRGYGRHGGPGRSFWLRALFSRLDTTPGQEKEIRSAIEDFQRAAREAKGDVFDSRESVAKAVAGEVFDPSAIDEASQRVDAATSRIKEALRAALERVHAVLDAKQRERLGEILARGPGAFRGYGGGPYRA